MNDDASALDRSLATLSEKTKPRAELGIRIQKECRPAAGTPHLSRRQRLLATVLVLSGGTLLFLTLLGQMQGIQHSGGLGLLGAAGWALAFATVLFSALYRPPGRRGSRRARSALVLLLLLLLFAHFGSLASRFLPLPTEFSAVQLSGVLSCGMSATLGGGAIALGMLVNWRRTDPFDPGVSGALVGLLGGLSGVLALGESCPSHELAHLWLGHGVAVLLVTLLGAILGKRWLAP